MRLQSVQFFNFNNINNKQFNNKAKKEEKNYSVTNPIGYGVTFEGVRVDKGLTRFYEANEHRMPQTVKKYIQSLDDKAIMTPLLAQASAFALIGTASTVEDIKEAYPEEELFNDLKNPETTNATRGILGVYRENKDLFDAAGQSILSDKQNLTVWLVKKVFVEGKTLEEINRDFKQDVDPDFMDFFSSKESSEEPLRHSTLKALGIKMPEFEYMQSLRYTRDGYSDLVGQTISAAQRKFWDSMPPEERTARARRTVERFEKWWNSLSQDKKLEMIAFQADELEMLEKYNDSEFNKQRTIKKKEEKQTDEQPVHQGFKTHTKVDSTLSKDDLFKIWAGNNLKLFEANLTERDREIINNKRMQRRAEAWEAMSAEEKTEYLEKLKTGSEYLRFAVIQAWNENPDILTELSYYLKKSNIEKPIDLLYGTEAFSDYMSKAMSNFWAINPEFATKFGESISNAHSAIKEAVADGKFETLKLDIIRARSQRMKETAMEIRNYREILTDSEYNSYPDYMKRFIDECRFAPDSDYKSLPSQYLKDFFKITYETLTPEQIDSWIKNWKRQPLSESDRDNLKAISEMATFDSEKMNRALEATLADAIYKCTENPDVYVLHSGHCKLAMKQIMNGDDNVVIPLSDGTKVSIPIVNHNVNVKEIDKKYELYREDMPELDIGSIADRFLVLDNSVKMELSDFQFLFGQFLNYLRTYGKSLEILFKDENNVDIEIKEAYLQKFMDKMPVITRLGGFDIILNKEGGLEREDKISQVDNNLRNRFNMIPKSILNPYIYETNKRLRKDVPDRMLNGMSETLKTTNDRNISIERKQMYIVNQYKFLAAEQAMADIMSEVTGQDDFYRMPIEALLLMVQAAATEKKFPYQHNCSNINNMPVFSYTVKRRPNLYKMEKLYKEYDEELTKYIAETVVKKEKIEPEEIMYILNPEENKETVDKYTLERVNKVAEYLK